MSKEKIIQRRIYDIATLSGDQTNYNKAKEVGADTYLTYDNAPHYGGYRLNRVRTEGGGHCAVFDGYSSTESRMKYSEFSAFLLGLEIGLKLKKG